MNKATRLGTRNWIILLLLGLSGQIAWNVENSWFNTFVFDTITPDPRPIAIMVAVSAIVATLTTLIMGTLSDRVGRRRPFILFGYILWALATMAYPLSSWSRSAALAVFLVITLDAVMTFFGSTANDAAFNAWVTDITDKTNRGTAEAVLTILPVLAIMLGMGLSGIIIDTLGYLHFFLLLGGLVLVMGLAGSFLLEESPGLRPNAEKTGFLAGLLSVFTPRSIGANRELYLVFTALALYSISMEIVFPYEMIYLNNYLGISKSMAGILVAVIAPVLIIFALPVGKLTDNGHGFTVIVTGYLLGATGNILFSLSGSMVMLGITGALKSFGYLMNIVLGAWIRNLMPEESRGQFQGVRLIFMVAIPMVIGPVIGSAIIQNFGIPTVTNGEKGFIPVPLNYQVSALLGLLPLVPVYLLHRRCRATGRRL